MKHLVRLSILTALIAAACVAFAQSPPEFDSFQHDPVSYFAGSSHRMWVGNIGFMMDNYSDTLRLGTDSSGHGITISRVLVRMSDSTVVSRGTGLVTPNAGDPSFAVVWNEVGYKPATGVMNWGDHQWEISFDGEWKQWFINVRKQSDTTFTAALARAVANFPPVELTQMTYIAVPAKR
jgi:hypothetical protein